MLWLPRAFSKFQNPLKLFSGLMALSFGGLLPQICSKNHEDLRHLRVETAATKSDSHGRSEPVSLKNVNGSQMNK